MDPNNLPANGISLFDSAVQSLINPFAMREYINTRDVIQPQLFLQRLLPPVRSTTAQITNGNVRVIAGPALPTGIDSPYQPVGDIKTQFNRNGTFKITGTQTLNESMQDAMHEAAQNSVFVAATSGNGMGAGNAAMPIYQGFIARVIDAAALSLDLGEEQMRARALAFGRLNETVTNGERKIQVKADYGIDFNLAFRDRKKGPTSYIGTASAFWDDHSAARSYLLLEEPVLITDPVTWDAIKRNPVNAIAVISQVQITPTTRRLTIGRKATISSETPSGAFLDVDINYRADVIVYGLKDETTGNYFWPKGRVTWFTQSDRQITLIDGVIVSGALGVTHQGPTTEIGNVPGRYIRAYTPDGRPYQMKVDVAEDILPDLMDWRNIFMAETAVS